MPEYLGGERVAVQEPLIRYACDSSVGWVYISKEEALRLRGGETGFVFREIFVDQMAKLNQGFMDSSQAEELIKQLERIPPTVEGNLAAWEYLKGLKTIFVPNEKRERNVTFIDAENIERNTFHVTDEFTFTNGTMTNRYDVVFLINGVPVFLVETKSAHKIEGISEALDQMRRYHRETPEMMALFQVYALTHIIRFYYSATWNFSIKYLFDWKEEVEKGGGYSDYEGLVKCFFDRERCVKVISDYILFTRQDDELNKVVLRPHQMRGVVKIVERAADAGKKRGLVWHTQGSGKTYTMIVAAKKILENPLFENPTVIMLVDRNELESQLFGNLSALGFENAEVADTKAHLRDLLSSDKRGLIVSMIHKFEGVEANINTRENIFVLVDEAHRTTGGKLGNYLMGALPNATYIGFTGTPIDKTIYGTGTFKTFGIDDPPKGYLDKYSIAESIRDGTTVPLHYTLAPNELKVDRETLEKEFLDLAEAEGISDVEELNKVLERAVTLKNEIKSPARREKIARFLAGHFKEYVEPMGYKAFLVAVDREACALYKEELDKHLPSDYSKVVYSPFHNDPPELAKYHLSEEEEKRIRKAFRKPDKLPKILIVTEKLLTGFDAPILYCMYLDKPMRDHVLLQAIARVNRPYEDEEGRKKPSGFVLDFVGIFDNLEKALSFDSSDVEGILHDIGVLKGRFSELIQSARENYLTLIKDKTQDKAVEAVLEHFKDEKKRHEYYKFFREISDIYEILSPDAFLRPYVEDFETLARMYRILREAFEPGIPVDREFTRKTAKLVQKHTKGGAIRAELEIYEIDDDTLRKIEESKASETEKVFNLLRSIGKSVIERAKISPYLISIGERAEMVAALYKQRQMDTLGALEELKRLVEEINKAMQQQAEKQMTPEVFSLYWLFEKRGIYGAEEKAKEMEETLEKFPHWKTSEKHDREVRRKLYKILVNAGLEEDVPDVAQNIMKVLKGG